MKNWIKNIKNKAKTYALVGTMGFLSLGVLSNECLAQDRSAKASVYYDTRGGTNITMTGLSKNIAGTGFKGFGFFDLLSEFNQKSFGALDLKKIYGEARISKEIIKGLGLAVEYNGNLEDQNVWRFGFVYEPGFGKIIPKVNLNLKLFPKSTEGKGPQIAVYGGGKLSKTTSIGGFVDYNFKSKKVVSEIQLNQNLKGKLDAVAEFRYNGFFPKEEKNRVGVGMGLEYKF